MLTPNELQELDYIVEKILGCADGLHTTNLPRSRQLDQIARELQAFIRRVKESS